VGVVSDVQPPMPRHLFGKPLQTLAVVFVGAMIVITSAGVVGWLTS
jgi:hypothetical protein